MESLPDKTSNPETFAYELPPAPTLNMLVHGYNGHRRGDTTFIQRDADVSFCKTRRGRRRGGESGLPLLNDVYTGLVEMMANAHADATTYWRPVLARAIWRSELFERCIAPSGTTSDQEPFHPALRVRYRL